MPHLLPLLWIALCTDVPGMLSDGDQGWSLSRTADNGAHIFAKPMPGTDAELLGGQMVLPFSSDAVGQVMSDLSFQKDFVPGFKEMDVLEDQVVGGKHVRLIFQVQDVMGARDREMVLRTETWSETGPLGVTWRSTFKAATEGGPEPDATRVRISDLWGQWAVLPRDCGDSVLVYTIYTDVGGTVPAAAARLGQQRHMQGLLERFDGVCAAHCSE